MEGKNSYLELHSELHAKQSAMKLYTPKGCFKLLSCLFTETSDVSERKKKLTHEIKQRNINRHTIIVIEEF